MLNGEQSEQLHNAILETFEYDSLEQLLYFKFNKSLANISASKDNFSNVVFDVIRIASQEGWTKELVDALHEKRPKETRFQILAEAFVKSDHEATLNAKESKSTVRSKAYTWIAVVGLILLGAVLFIMYSNGQKQPPITQTPTNEGKNNTFSVGSTRKAQKINMIQVYVPAGTFNMGSTVEEADALFTSCEQSLGVGECGNIKSTENERPLHKVYVDEFWIDQTEVNNEQFAEFVRETKHETIAEQQGASRIFVPAVGGFDWADGVSWIEPFDGVTWQDVSKYPVIHVTWDDANEFCKWRDARLPTEAEWEKSARWNESTQESLVYPWGNKFDGTKLNYCDQNCPFKWADLNVNDRVDTISPVGNYPDGASPYGALDMAGNVWEWVSDWYGEDYYSSLDSRQDNPQGVTYGGGRVVRGNSWSGSNYGMRSALRNANPPHYRNENVGFRCVQDVD